MLKVEDHRAGTITAGCHGGMEEWMDGWMDGWPLPSDDTDPNILLRIGPSSSCSAEQCIAKQCRALQCSVVL